MAEVSRLHRLHLPATTFVDATDSSLDDDEYYYQNPFAFDFETRSPPNQPLLINSHNFNLTANSDSDSDSDSGFLDGRVPFYIHGEDQMNYVTDLFAEDFSLDNSNSRNLNSRVFFPEESDFDGFPIVGIGSDSGSDKLELISHQDGVLGSNSDQNGSFDGVRVVDVGSASDLEEAELNSVQNGDFGRVQGVDIGFDSYSAEAGLNSGLNRVLGHFSDQNGDVGSDFDVVRVVGIGSESNSEEVEPSSDQNGVLGVNNEFWNRPRMIHPRVSNEGFCTSNGLRVVGIGSESDTDELELDSGIRLIDDQNAESGVNGFLNCLRVDNSRVSNEDLEWEEVNERGQDRDFLTSVIDGIEEISVSSDISMNSILEWEVLFDNIERSLEFYESDTEYELFGQFLGNEGTLMKGSPPAAKSIIENLPLVVLVDEGINKTACAVCKDVMLVSEKVTKLPCAHYYHCDCIVPWLNIRNTCPVCRHELPTDDSDYERRKHGTPSTEFQVRYSFEFVP